MERTGRIGFVPPRYGPGVVGGAEAVLAETARGLAERGWTVEILTTCARDHFTWANEFPEGVSVDGALTVRRFQAVVDTPRIERATFHARILAGETLTITEQQRWVNDDLRVPDLFHHLLDRGDEYRALVFAPYMFWPTFACGQVVPERTILMPCLHDEPEARLPLFAPLFSGAHGIWFLSEPEAALAQRIQPLPPRTAVVGAGVTVPSSYDPDGFRRRHGIDGRFVLYAGRREGAKGWEGLVASFADAVARHDLPFTLVTTGTGPVLPPDSLVGRVLDLGFLEEDELANAYSAADAYLQPSALESFSRTIMEAWLAGTPVIANAHAAVVRWHCERSGAGLLYETPEELAACLDFVAQRPEEARRLAQGGRDYVLEHYAPDDVLDRVETTLHEWTRPWSRVLVVSPYAPYRDGIAAYAVQQVKALRREGNEVEVLSPAPSAAHQWLDLRNRRGPIALARRVSRFDRLIIQYHPDVFFRVGVSPRDHAMSTAGLMVACRLARESEVVVHEFDDEPLRYGRRNRALTLRMWRSVDRLLFHTAIERDRFLGVWPVALERTALIAHGASFVPHTNADRAAARAVLGLPPDRFMFVAIGFIQPHKGFDRAVAAFAASGAASVGAQLHVVGSVRVDEPAFLQHRDELAAAIRQTRGGATLHDAYLSDEAFDLWLVAADAVVLPYRQIWSSGVMERAALYSRLVIATRVGGLGEQAPAGTVLVDDDAILAAAMAAAAGVISSPSAPAQSEPWPEGDREAIQAEVRRRARLIP